MKRWMKVTIGIVAGLAALLVVGVLVVFSRLDSIVHSTVESQGTQQLSLMTSLENANVSIFGGSLTLDDLDIANPEGYSADHFFEMGQVNVDVSYGGLTSDPVTIDAINLVAPKLVIERKPGASLADLGAINLREVLANISSEGETTKMTIDRINISGAEISIVPNVEGLDPVTVMIPEITMEGVGTADAGATGQELSRVIGQISMRMAREAAASEDLDPRLQAILAGDLNQVLASVGDQLKSELSSKLQDELGKQLDGLPDDLVENLMAGDAKSLVDDAVSGAVDDAKREAQGAIEEQRSKLEDDAKGALEGLFGGKKDDEKDE